MRVGSRHDCIYFILLTFDHKKAALRNCNYFLRFGFRLLTSYGSGKTFLFKNLAFLMLTEAIHA
jgi:hypothetical protein